MSKIIRKHKPEFKFKVAVEGLSSKSSKIADAEAQIRKLNEYIGELSVENKFFKKNLKF